MAQAATKFLSIRDIIVAIVLLVGFISAGAVGVNELQEKPSSAEMSEAINDKVDPVIARVAPVEQSVQLLTGNVERMQQLLELTMQHAEWRAEVADCRWLKSCKRAPSEPQSLKDKRRDLMTQRAR